MTTNPDQPSQNQSTQITQDYWAAALAQLQLQMTRATFDTWIKDSRFVSAEDGNFTVSVKNAFAQDWLQNRLRDTIKRALVHVTGQPDIRLVIVIDESIEAAAQEETPQEEMPSTNAAPAHTNGHKPADQLNALAAAGTTTVTANGAATSAAPTADELEFAGTTDFYGAKKAMGFWMFEFNYDNQFWPIFLLTKAYHLKRRLEDYWLEEHSKPEERDLNNPANHWTPPFRVTYRQMAGWLGVEKLAVVQGGENECYHSRSANLRREPLHKCCGKYTHHDWRETQPGCFQCFYWRSGLLQRLYDLGLLAIQIHKLGDHPRNHRIYVQVWRVLPFLTPLQVSTLPLPVQQDHKSWLKNFGHHFNLPYSQWESWTYPNHTPLLHGYKDGLKLHGQPEPNPFLLPRGSKKHNPGDDPEGITDAEANSLLPCGSKDDDFDTEFDDDEAIAA